MNLFPPKPSQPTPTVTNICSHKTHMKQVLPRPSMDPTEAAARLGVTAKSIPASGGADGAIPKAEDAKYLGCYSSESFFGGREYVGGSSGANYNLIYHHAKQVRCGVWCMMCGVVWCGVMWCGVVCGV